MRPDIMLKCRNERTIAVDGTALDKKVFRNAWRADEDTVRSSKVHLVDRSICLRPLMELAPYMLRGQLRHASNNWET